jgi:electron transfer flavoprotein beta subunit
MQIYVCVKHVPDSAARITILDKNRFDESVFFLINPYDENAIEAAVSLKEKMGDSEIIAITLGKAKAINTLRAALSLGVDRGIFIKTNHYPDSLVTARALKTAIEQDGQADIIFTGKESIDSEGMQTLFRLAQGMDIPVATNVVYFSLDENNVTVECEMEAGAREVLEMSLPCIIGAGKGLNTPRYAKLSDIMKARKKEIKQLDLDCLDLDTPSGSIEILELKPVIEERKGKILSGEPEEVIKEFVEILTNEAKIF